MKEGTATSEASAGRVRNLKLSNRALRVIDSLGATDMTVAEFSATHTETSLLLARGCGRTTLREIKQQLATCGLSLNGPRHPHAYIFSNSPASRKLTPIQRAARYEKALRAVLGVCKDRGALAQVEQLVADALADGEERDAPDEEKA